MRYYELRREVFTMSNKEASEAIRNEAFVKQGHVPTEAEKESMFKAQSLFIEDVRKSMKEGQPLEELKEYHDNKFAIMPSKVDEMEYLIVIFDMKVDELTGMLPIHYDKEEDKFYLLKEDEQPVE